MSGARADTVPSKTMLGREVLQGRAFPGSRSLRLFLIMVDGRKSLKDLQEAARQLGIDNDAIQHLVDQGLMAWQSADESLSRDSVPDATKTASALASRAARSLAAAKLYALELAVLMLPEQQASVREEARQVTDEVQLRQWLGRIADRVTSTAGHERSALFLQRVGALLPEDVMPTALECSDAHQG